MKVTAKHRETGQTVQGRLVTVAHAIGKEKARRLGYEVTELGILEEFEGRKMGWFKLGKLKHVLQEAD